jgi:hypothetical protein
MRRSASASGILEKSSQRSSGSFDMNNSRSIISFLHRQNECERLRRERLEDIFVETAPTLQPTICDRSALLAERRRSRREQSSSDSRSLLGIAADADALKGVLKLQDQECTFKPVITKLAKDMELTSISVRTEGEMKRREAKAAKLREELREKEMQGVSFEPNLNTADTLPPELAQVPSSIQVLEKPDAYLKQLEKKRLNTEKAHEREKKRNLEKEMAECTFKPEVRSAPEFVQRMAETYRLVRNLKEKENYSHDGCLEDAVRPEWR